LHTLANQIARLAAIVVKKKKFESSGRKEENKNNNQTLNLARHAINNYPMGTARALT